MGAPHARDRRPGADSAASQSPERERPEVHAPPGTDPELSRIGVYRAAFRQVLRHRGLDNEERVRALMNLSRRARGERYAEMICIALFAELRWDLDREEVSRRRDTGDRLERRHRSMRAEGYDSCPRCLTELSRQADWDAWRAMREAAIVEAEAREGAVA